MSESLGGIGSFPPAAGAVLPGVERIAVLRANGLGDLMFALPALDALRNAYPTASITLLGKAWHEGFLRDRPGPVTDVFVLPDIPGITVPPTTWGDGRAGSGTAQDPVPAVRDTIERLRARRFDLALQLFGGGRYSNPFVAALGAARSVGLQAPDAPPLDMSVPYRYFQSEVLRLLEVVGLVGAAPVGLEPRLSRTAADGREAAQALAGAGVGPAGYVRCDGEADGAGHLPLTDVAGSRPLVAIHPGAGDGRRRWPPEDFGWVARRLADRGARVVVLGAEDEKPLCAQVIAASGEAAEDLAGRLTVNGLVGVLEHASLLIASDSGPLHLAQAVGTPTVGIFWCGNLITAGPMGRRRHRPLCSWRLECPVCGVNCITGECGHHQSFVAEVPAEEVLQEALSLLGTA